MHDFDVVNAICSQMQFDIKICAYIKHDRSWVEHESKDNYDIWVITEGSLNVQMDGCAYRLNVGDVFFFYPQKLYTATSISESCAFVYMRFDVCLGENTRPLNHINVIARTYAKDVDSEVQVFLTHCDQFRRNLPMTPLLLKASLMMLISRIAIQRTQNNCHPNHLAVNPSYPKLEKLLAYIHNNIDKPLSIKMLSDFMYLSEKYFISYFKFTFGVTPHNYISTLKLKTAFEYLSEQKYSVKEAAQMTGYVDAYTFSKAFKRYYGFPPNKLLKKLN
ncbi:MAG: helix-turn-helix transcriptional regulator [Hyphomonadaceae bacterium]|nr:helix-turn-helix transcriptional regulator [Clostridia bacterium]